MLPELWGPYAWHLYHTVAYSYIPDSRKNPYQHFFKTYETIIPCRQCRFHAGEWMDDHPLEDTRMYAKWVNEFHNAVSVRLGKDQWSSEEVHNLYFKNGVLQVDHAKIFKWIDIVVREADEEHPHANISDFQDYIVFFNSLRDVFPCPTCRDKLRLLMEEYPISEVSDAKSLQEWYKKISEPWKRGHLFLNTDTFLVYRKSGSKRWFFRKINMKGATFAERNGDNIVLTLENGGTKNIELPEDVDLENMTVATETDLEFTQKVIAKASQK